MRTEACQHLADVRPDRTPQYYSNHFVRFLEGMLTDFEQLDNK